MLFTIGTVRVGLLRSFAHGPKKELGVEVIGYTDRFVVTATGAKEKVSDRHKLVEYDPAQAQTLLNNFAKKAEDGSFEKDQWGNYSSNGRNLEVSAQPHVNSYSVERKNKVTLTLPELQAAMQQMQAKGVASCEIEFPVPVKVQETTFIVDRWNFVDAPKNGNNAPVVSNAPVAKFSFSNGVSTPATLGEAAALVGAKPVYVPLSPDDDSPF